MNHRVTTTIQGKTITSEEFYREAQRWASRVRALAKRNALGFAKGTKKKSKLI